MARINLSPFLRNYNHYLPISHAPTMHPPSCHVWMDTRINKNLKQEMFFSKLTNTIPGISAGYSQLARMFASRKAPVVILTSTESTLHPSPRGLALPIVPLQIRTIWEFKFQMACK
jgi:hypothetical protein